jgi:hypothetical protein
MAGNGQIKRLILGIAQCGIRASLGQDLTPEHNYWMHLRPLKTLGGGLGSG